MPILSLTTAFIANGLTVPEGKPRIEYCDEQLPGLYIEVRATSPGQGTYYLRYKDKTGKTCHQKIGRTSEISLLDARKQAKTLKAEIALGANPKGEEKATKPVFTYTAFFNEKYMPHVTVRKRSWKRDEELFRLRIQKEFGDKQLDAITRQQIQGFHTDLLTTGLSGASCDHHVKLIRQSLNLAVEWDMLDKNPASNVPLFNMDNKVENYLDEGQLDSLLKVLRSEKNARSVCQIAMFLLSTGARLNEALQATWSQIDQQTRVWRIPASNSKSKRIRSVPLNDSAFDVLSQLDTEGSFDYLFVNRKTELPYTTVHKVWGRLRKKAGLPFLRIHDLRHLYASFLVNGGRTLYEVQQILGHSDPSVTQRYAHLSTKSLQDAANSASVMIRRGMPVSEVTSAAV
ncbi:MAG: tyrosine-type recombinase/integrase [Polynucleobacter sp.]|uniref:site-specific integrase n=1 Tax=Polynucleobacter sp. TaxID=2029855 RepID=UPI00271FA803|nr:site-specific integrase [Polynucleobacter sp.]MDO8713332.1 tyrosine-type recombinase/integrase [Polynucleobacter sp.]